MNPTEKFLNSIDWMLLSEQKMTLVNVVMVNADAPEGVVEHLDGILSLLDSLQDFAADEFGMTTYFARCDVCGVLAEDESVQWCGNCGCCVEHCQKNEDCEVSA
jgi:hypothetical protein